MVGVLCSVSAPFFSQVARFESQTDGRDAQLTVGVMSSCPFGGRLVLCLLASSSTVTQVPAELLGGGDGIPRMHRPYYSRSALHQSPCQRRGRVSIPTPELIVDPEAQMSATSSLFLTVSLVVETKLPPCPEPSVNRQKPPSGRRRPARDGDWRSSDIKGGRARRYFCCTAALEQAPGPTGFSRQATAYSQSAGRPRAPDISRGMPSRRP